jgi:hypothetical protein
MISQILPPVDEFLDHCLSPVSAVRIPEQSEPTRIILSDFSSSMPTSLVALFVILRPIIRSRSRPLARKLALRTRSARFNARSRTPGIKLNRSRNQLTKVSLTPKFPT